MVSPVLRCRPNGSGTSACALSTSMRKLCNVMWHMGYGMVVGVHFRSGDVLDNPPHDIIRKARTTEDAWPHFSAPPADFVPKREHIRLIEELGRTGTGTIDIKVVNGLPIDLDIRTRASV